MSSSSSNNNNSWGDHRQGKSDTFNRNTKPPSNPPSRSKDTQSSKWDNTQFTPPSTSHTKSSSQVSQKAATTAAAGTTTNINGSYKQSIPTPTYSGQSQSYENKKNSNEPQSHEQQKKQEKEEGRFENFNLSDKTIEGLTERGINYLFPIQAGTYHDAFKSKDIIGRALTGTGKTLSFALPIIERLRSKKVFKTSKGPKVVVLAPTRELALQVSQEFDYIKHSSREYNVLTVYGGVSYDNQEYQLAQGIDVLVGTVGRVLDHINKGNIRLDSVNAFVLDEADQMLNMGFKDDVQKIINAIKRERPAQEGLKKAFQIMLYSATIPGWVKGVANQHLQSNYVNIDLVKNLKNKTAKKVDHLAINVPFYTRASTLADVLLCYGGKDKKTIVFAQTKNECNSLLQNEKMKMNIDVLHGDIPQNQREVTMKRFRQGVIQALIATDVAARGLDIDNVDLIIQTEPPKDYETYIHRSGRTARAGKNGTCITFYTPKQKQQLQFIEFKAGIQFQRIGAPQPKDIITASSRDIHNSLDKVSDDVLPFFQNLAEDIINDLGAKRGLCKALAFMSGNLSKIENRSLLTGTENQITFQLIFSRQIQYPSYARTVLRDCNGRIASDIRFFKMLKSKRGVVFDIDESDLNEFERSIHDVMHAQGSGKWQCSRVHDLPELQDNEGNSGGGGGYQSRGGYNNQGYGGGSYGGDRRNGGGRGNNNWGSSQRSNSNNRWGNQSNSSWGGHQSNPSWGGGRGGGSDNGGGWNNSYKDYSSGGNSKISLFIGNLPFHATEENLNSWINKHGVSVANVRILKDQDGKSRGVGFADLSYSNDLDKALRLSKSQFDGRPISIQKCKPKQPYSK